MSETRILGQLTLSLHSDGFDECSDVRRYFLGALGSCFSFVATVTIIPFIPNGWAPSAGGFPAMTETVAFLLKDLVLLAVSVYLLRQDVLRVSQSGKESPRPAAAQFQRT